MDQKSKEAAIRSLMSNEGWTLVMQPEIEVMIKELEKQLFTTHGEYNKRVYTMHDLFRMCRAYLINIKEVPHKVIKTA